MVGAPGFDSWDQMQNSAWLAELKESFQQGRWPSECRRCQTTEVANGHSIRLDATKRDAILDKFDTDYLILGGVLDNICNSACQSCNSKLSTKIGSLHGRDYPRINNYHLLSRIPMDRVLEIDLNGGEPAASGNYQNLLENLPPAIKLLRVNTNGSRLLPNIGKILEQGIQVIITLSLDGIDRVHDYVRWPIKWNNYVRVVEEYQTLRKNHHNLRLQTWTTVHALNLADFDNIKRWSASNGLEHSWAYLEQPQALNVKYKNTFTLPCQQLAPDIIACDSDNQTQIDRFIADQNKLRGINIKDYL